MVQLTLGLRGLLSAGRVSTPWPPLLIPSERKLQGVPRRPLAKGSGGHYHIHDLHILFPGCRAFCRAVQAPLGRTPRVLPWYRQQTGGVTHHCCVWGDDVLLLLLLVVMVVAAVADRGWRRGACVGGAEVMYRGVVLWCTAPDRTPSPRPDICSNR
ncbi:hypothetical protein E2C01_034259 [Portunus trituberculatus]|uniref:Uncharacterized protein n=1 Tax=Portunus trituberculatus TaxID=210409 RepID=A0A5B7F821_PORTR|nr:hypothetical protein [Portunus trituberculatus]